MNKSQVFELLKQNKNDRGIAHWHKLENTYGLESYGIGLTVLRKLAKQIGRDHDLALELWASNNYDAKNIGLLIDEPKKVTREQAESQVEGVAMGMLVHVFSSCNATLPKTKFAPELAHQWLESDSQVRRRCAYGVMYELSKNKTNKKLDDDYFMVAIDQIVEQFSQVKPAERGAMGGSLLGIGKRSKVLNKRAIEVATSLGPIDFSEDNSSCEPMNVLKHLTSDYIKDKLGITL